MKNTVKVYVYASRVTLLWLTIFTLTAGQKAFSAPVIVNVSSDQNLVIFSGHEKVHLKCWITGQNITDIYWEKKAADSNSLPTKLDVSKITHHNGRTILHLIITKPQPTESGVYCCVVDSRWGMVKSRNVQVNIRIAPPRLIIQPNNVTVVALTDVEFNCTTEGYKVKIKWKRHSDNETIGKHTILTIFKATPLDKDWYYCVASNGGGSVHSNKAILSVNDFINSTITPQRVVVTKNTSVKLEIIAEGPGKENFEYSWRRGDNTPLPRYVSGENTPYLTIASITASDSGPYYCIVVNQWGNVVESDRAVINVLYATLHPQSKTIATGQTIVLTCTVHDTDTDNLTYWWTKKGGKSALVPLVVNSSNLLMISNATVGDSGMYNCIVLISASSNTTIKSNPANVTVLALPVITVHPNDNGNITVAEGSNVTLRCRATGKRKLNYRWIRVSEDETVVANKYKHLIISNVTISDSGVYYCEVSNGGTYVSSMGVQVTVKGRPTIISISKDQNFYITSENETVMLTCEVTGDDIIDGYWIRDNGPLPNKSNHSSFDGHKINLTITKVHPYYSGNFFCVIYSYWDVTISTAVSVGILAAPPRITDQPIDKVVIALSNVTFTCRAKGFHVTFEWRYYINNSFVVKSNSFTLTLLEVTPSDEGVYGCVAMTGHGKSHLHQVFTNNVTLTVNDSFTVKISLYPHYMIVVNESITFNVIVEGLRDHSYTYQWYKTSSDSLPSASTGQYTPNLIIKSVTPSDGGLYYCEVTNQWGNSIASNSELLKVLYFTETFNHTIAVKGSHVSLSCNVSVPDSVQCKWKHNGKDINDSNNLLLELFDVGANNEGTYTCVITRNDQVLFASTAKLEVLDVKLQPLNNLLDLGASVSFTCESSILSTVTYEWLHNGTILENDTSAILSIRNAQWSDAGVLYCRVTTINNISKDSNGITLTLQPSSGDKPKENKHHIGHNLFYLICFLFIPIVLVGIYGRSKFRKKRRKLPRMTGALDNRTTRTATGDNRTQIIDSMEIIPLAALANIQVTITSSRSIMEVIDELYPKLQEHINVQCLLSYLHKYNVLDSNENQRLMLIILTPIEKAQKLLEMLRSKSPEGQENFVKALYESSQELGSSSGHHKIIQLFLTNGITIRQDYLHLESH